MFLIDLKARLHASYVRTYIRSILEVDDDDVEICKTSVPYVDSLYSSLQSYSIFTSPPLPRSFANKLVSRDNQHYSQ